MKTRKLITLCGPPDWDKSRPYRIRYAYYDERGRWTGERESADLTEEELYQVFKPHLEYEKEKGGR